MSTRLTVLPHADLPALAPAAAAGFPRLSYTLDVLDGEIDPPDEMFGVNMGMPYMTAFLPQLRNDPLRRKIARGEVKVAAVPVTFVNTGTEIRVQGQTFPGDPALLRWCLAEGIRTGVSFRVPMNAGRCGSLNFYSPRLLEGAALEAALPDVFLAGHRLHAAMAPRRSAGSERLLSRREMECLQALARGGSNGQIARELGVSTETVKDYLHGLFRKLQVRNRAEAVSRGCALNYLRPTP